LIVFGIILMIDYRDSHSPPKGVFLQGDKKYLFFLLHKLIKIASFVCRNETEDKYNSWRRTTIKINYHVLLRQAG
jgi:hypothetical protein